MAFIEARNVYKRYAAHTALDNVCLSIKRGKVFGLLGPNGAGKTSLIRIINRITAPDSGQILFDGRPLKSSDVQRIGYLPEERGLYRKMKVGDHALYLAELHGLSRKEAKQRLEKWFDRLDIMPWWNKRVEELSKGMQQKIQFVCTVLHEPELLIFDEPFSGFDPVNADLLKREILTLRDQGKTIIFSTHNMQSVEEVCDDIALINRSKVVLSGSVANIRQQHATPYVRLTLNRPLSESECATLPLVERGKQTNSGYTYRLCRSKEMTNLNLIASLPRDLDLITSEQEIPSMHEIFIQTIQHHG
ncbi:MAG: ABC transporter ATP-binding protein [Porphyromonadaceae bacterium]|nr:ABC transporter ATP-binding protein [Porphyromonadaceae bacterium]